MGTTVCKILAEDSEAKVICGVDLNVQKCTDIPLYSDFSDVKENVDVIIDFSSPSALRGELNWAKNEQVPVILASTGYSAEDLQFINDCAKEIAIFKTANLSIGINLLIKLVREAAERLNESFDVEIVEKHHRLKADAPSGTALMLADSINNAFNGNKDYIYGREGLTEKRGKEIGIHAVRGGTIVGEHEVIFAGEDEIVTISHSARSKKVFAEGAVRAAKWIVGKPAGIYDMQDLLKNR